LVAVPNQVRPLLQCTPLEQLACLGAPHRGLSMLIRRIRSRSSVLTMGRPDRRRLFHAQYRRNPCRCQPTTVSSRATCTECRQLVHRPTAEPRRSGPSASAAAAADEPSTRRVAAVAQDSPTQLAVCSKTASSCSEEDSEPSEHDRRDSWSVRRMQLNRAGRLFRRDRIGAAHSSDQLS
jgi:hypothetical protein